MNPIEFEKYQVFTEETINKLSHKVMKLEKKLDMFTNLLEISKYINQNIKDPNLVPLINDMLIGIFGAKYSTIYIKMNEEYHPAIVQDVPSSVIEIEKELIKQFNEEEFILNSKDPIYANIDMDEETHSCLGVPVKVENHLLAFILIQHHEINYFTRDHAVFLELIGNHIGVAIDNYFLYKKISISAYLDGLTELYNKRYFFETLTQMKNLNELNYSIAIVDLDDFKSINDNYGHPMGDIVLKRVADILKNNTRTRDIVARYGGDEMIIYFDNFTDKEKVMKRISRIREEIESTIYTDEQNSINISASFGVYIKTNEALSLDEVIKRADEIMYISKKEGKNKVTIGS